MKLINIKMDLEDIKEQVSDLREGMARVHFRKPWTVGRDTTPALYLGLGALLASALWASTRYGRWVIDVCTGERHMENGAEGVGGAHGASDDGAAAAA